jgi:hypothetical protein
VGLILGGQARADDEKPPENPSGTIHIEQFQVALFVSANLGGGTLTYQGKSYPFTIGGLGYGGLGASSMIAGGEVFHMDDISQFEGVYGQARYGFAFDDESSGQLWMQNPNGVLIHVVAEREGYQLALGGDGIVIAFD